MTKHLRFLFVMLLAMIWSAGWAAETKTVVCTLAQKSNACTADVNGVVSWSYAAAKSTDSNHRGIQWSAPKDVILTANFTSVVKITEVVVNANTNIKNNGNCTIALNVGSTSYGEKDIVKGDANAGGNANYSYIGTESSNVMTLKLNSSRSLYINTVTITYEVGDSKTDTKVSFGENSGKTFTFTEGKYSDVTFTTPTATETTGVAGTIAYSSNNATAISVDASTGALTFPGYGTATITATFTPNDTEKYAESTDTYTVVNAQKVSENVLTFSNDLNSFDKADDYATGVYTMKDVVFVGSDNKSYTFNTNGGKFNDGNLRFILPKLSNGNFGKLVSPKFSSYVNGYKVVITYGIGGSKYPSISANGETVKGTVKGNYNNGTGATLSLDVADGSAFTVTSDNALAISKIEITPNKVDETTTITLNENSESNTIEAKTGVNVTLNRPMKIGQWNTFCVPFSIDANQVTSQFGEGTQIAEYSVSKSKDEVIAFATVQSNAIVAGKAYLVKPTKEAATEGYTFSNVNITALKPTKETVDNGAIDFRGIYNPTDITEDLPENTFAAGIVGNVVKKAVSDSNMKGFRAFFIIPEGAGAQSSYMLKIDGTATSINSINGADVVVNAPVYNLQGQRVDGNNLTPGIYVKAGKKFVVK